MLALVVALLQIQVRDEPKDWKLIETPHFRIYYPLDEILPRAREFAAWFEKARGELVQTMGTEPETVNVFLYRSYLDLAQSSFLAQVLTPAPLDQRIRRSVLKDPPRASRYVQSNLDRKDCPVCRLNAKSRALALSEPERNRIFIHCQGSDRWNFWFIKHELAHQFQFQALFPLRVPSWELALKDPLIPEWWWEGGADYWAGVFDSEKDQWVRDLASERLYDLKELYSLDTLNFYDYEAIYYEGSYFWRFLDEEYGAGTGRKLYDKTGHGLPLASQKPVQHVVGKDRAQIETEFARNLNRKWDPLMAGRTVPQDRLTDTRKYYRRQAWGGRWSPDGKHLAWVSDADTWPELYVDGKGIFGLWRGIDTGFMNSHPSWSPDGKSLAVIEWTVNRDQIVLVHLDGGNDTIRVPDLDELYDVEWSPDGKKLALAALKDGRSDIYLLTLEDRSVERITDHQWAYWGPAWGPDGRLAYIKEEDGHTMLVVHGQGAVTKSWALLDQPEWSPDGKKILLAADVGGVWDAFEVDPATGKATRLTRVRGGISFPAYHPTDGTIVVTYFQGRGTDLFRIKPERQDEPGFDEEGRKSWYDQFKKPPPAGEPAEKTRVFGVNYLMFPVTSTSLLLPGVDFSFGDRDAENTFTLSAYGASGRIFGVSGTVLNTRCRPNVGATGSAGYYGDLFEAAAEPFIEVPLWTTITTGVGWIGRLHEEEIKDTPDTHFYDSGPTASFLFTNLFPVHLHDWEWGVAFGGTATFYREEFGGDRELNDYLAFFEVTNDIFGQDWLIWFRSTFHKMAAREFLLDEFIKVQTVVRGARALESIESIGTSLEFRFPLYRDFMWQPFELIGLGEWMILKDLRGFVFWDDGYLRTDVGGLVNQNLWAYSVGAGIRLDFSFMFWPIVNGRVPIRIDFWGAFVSQAYEPKRGALGFTYVLGF